jgi:hypothetical protein
MNIYASEKSCGQAVCGMRITKSTLTDKNQPLDVPYDV